MVSVGRVCRAWSIAASEVAREKYRQGFEKLFCEYIGEHHAILLARSLESELHALHGYLHGCFLPKAYKETARRLKFNLRDPKNGVLRTRLFDGQLSLSTLVRMKASDMANPELVKQRKEWIRKRTLEVIRNTRELQGFCYSSTLFNCPSCGSNETQHGTSRRKASADRASICMWVKSPQEEALYARIFAMADVDKNGQVQGKTAVDLFTKSGLSPAVLKQVWSLASAKMLPYLDRDEFDVALGLIALAQKGDSVDLATLASAGRAGRLPLPVFEIKELQTATSTLGNNQFNAVTSVKQLSAASTMDEMLQTQVVVQNQLHSSLAGIPPVQLPAIATLLQPLQALGYHFPDTANTLSEASLDDLEVVLLRYIEEVKKDLRTASGSMPAPTVSVATLIQTLSNLKQQSLRLLEQKEEAIARHGHSRPDLHVDVNFSQDNSSFDAPLTNWNAFEASAAPTTSSFEATVGPSEADPFGFDAAFMGSTGGSHMPANPTEVSIPSTSPIEKPMFDAFESANSSTFSAFDAMNDMDWGFASNNQLQGDDAWNKPPKEAVRSSSVHSGFGTAPKQDLGPKKVSAKSLTTEAVPEAPVKAENAFAAFDDKNFGAFPATGNSGGDFRDFTAEFGETRSQDKPENDSFGDFATAGPSSNSTFGSPGATFEAFPSNGSNFELFQQKDGNDNSTFDAFPQSDFTFSQTSDGSGFGALSEPNTSFDTGFDAFSAAEPQTTEAFASDSAFGTFDMPSAQDQTSSGFDAFGFSEQPEFSTGFNSAVNATPSLETSDFPGSQVDTNEGNELNSPRYSSIPQTDNFVATGFDAFPSPVAKSPAFDMTPPEEKKDGDSESAIVSPPTAEFASFEFSQESKTSSIAPSPLEEAFSFSTFNVSPPADLEPLGSTTNFNSVEFGAFDSAPFPPAYAMPTSANFSDQFMEFGAFASTTSQDRLSFTDAFANIPSTNDPSLMASESASEFSTDEFNSSSAQASSTEFKQTNNVTSTMFEAIDSSFANSPEVAVYESTTIASTVEFAPSHEPATDAFADTQDVNLSLNTTIDAESNVSAIDSMFTPPTPQEETPPNENTPQQPTQDSLIDSIEPPNESTSDFKPTTLQDEERDGSFVMVPSPLASNEVVTANEACGCFCLPTEDTFNNASLPSEVTTQEAEYGDFPSHSGSKQNIDATFVSPQTATVSEQLDADFGVFSIVSSITQEATSDTLQSPQTTTFEAPNQAEFNDFSSIPTTTTNEIEQPIQTTLTEQVEVDFGAFNLVHTTTEDVMAQTTVSTKVSHLDFGDFSTDDQTPAPVGVSFEEFTSKPTTGEKHHTTVGFGDIGSSTTKTTNAFGDFATAAAAPSSDDIFGDFVFPQDSRAKSDPGIAFDAFPNANFASVPANPSDEVFADFADFTSATTASNWASFSPHVNQVAYSDVPTPHEVALSKEILVLEKDREDIETRFNEKIVYLETKLHKAALREKELLLQLQSSHLDRVEEQHEAILAEREAWKDKMEAMQAQVQKQKQEKHAQEVWYQRFSEHATSIGTAEADIVLSRFGQMIALLPAYESLDVVRAGSLAFLANILRETTNDTVVGPVLIALTHISLFKDTDLRYEIAAAGVISPLVHITESNKNSAVLAEAARLLASLGLSALNKTSMASKPTVKALTKLIILYETLPTTSNVLAYALSALVNLAHGSDVLRTQIVNAEIIPCVSRLLGDTKDVHVKVQAAKLLCNIGYTGISNQTTIFMAQGDAELITCLRLKNELEEDSLMHVSLQENAALGVSNLASTSATQISIGYSDVITSCLQLLVDSKHPSLLEACALVLASLSYQCKVNKVRIASQNGIHVCLYLLNEPRRFGSNCHVMSASCYAIASLVLTEANLRIFDELEGHRVIVPLCMSTNDVNLMEASAMAIAALIPTPAFKFKQLSCGKDIPAETIGALPALERAAFTLFKQQNQPVPSWLANALSIMQSTLKQLKAQMTIETMEIDPTNPKSDESESLLPEMFPRSYVAKQ
ncbi:hypothetical protein THRCLA_06934 [Thraustotheca clavata]|uniref:EH domain-containing protein n=1 Tax=Thraustotheca clavata TaxID=74557 RepID=A0A1V9ZHV3_9STRA|nr:hypothetical protein THRCLA_06934 [Thraustotheca clavata]